MRNLGSAPRRPAGILALLAGILLLPGTAGAAVETTEDLERIFDGFYHLSLDTGTAYTAKGFRLQKDAMALDFESGSFLLAGPLEGEITGAYFVGKGRARMTAPVAMERKQLARYTGAESLDVGFSEMFLRFSDDTGSRIQQLPKGDPGTLPVPAAEIQSRFAERNDQLFRFTTEAMGFLESRISGFQDRNGFLTVFKTTSHPMVAFSLDPTSSREVFLGHFEKVGAYYRPYPWCSFHQAADYDEGGRYVADPNKDQKNNLDILDYDMKVNVLNLKSVEVDAGVKFTALAEGLKAARFDLLNSLDIEWTSGQLSTQVSAVIGEDGNPLPYAHKQNQLLVLLPRTLGPGETYSLRVKAREDIIEQLTKESFSLLNTYPWYPQYGYLGGRATFEWEVRVPKPYQATGSGRLIREWEEKDANASVWKSDIPVQFPSLLFGRFQRESGAFKSAANGQSVQIHVHAFPLMTSTITDPLILELLGYSSPTTLELRVPATKMSSILEESKQIITLFEDIYGPFPYDELDIAQMAPQFGFGQAPPGLVQLTGAAFLSQSDLESDFLHGFLSHEIAHQWWGHVIGWFEDEDVWLSESFAEYSSGIFIQQYQGEKRFQQEINNWRERAKISDSVAPIALANRASGDTGGRDRTYLLYNKGPLVVHMLRTMVGDDNYKTAMRAFTERYRHQNVKTEHLQQEFEKVVGYKLDWFFDQWFRETGIPSIRFRYEVKPTEDGKYLFTGHFKQDPATFKRFLGLPVTFQFGKDQMAVQKVMIKGPEETVQLKLPMEPKKVIVDEGNALLAEIIYEKPAEGQKR